MKAGNTNYDVGTRIRIKGIKDEDDSYLNGKIGSLTHPFASYQSGVVGVYLDKMKGDVVTLNSHSVNLEVDEFEIYYTLDEMIERALNAFWDSVVKDNPNIKGLEFKDSKLKGRFENISKKVIEYWIENNKNP